MKRIFIGLLLILMGGAVLSWSSRTTTQIASSATWPTAQGTVLRSGVVRDSTRNKGGGYNKMFRADVEYRYMINGGSYESNVFVFGVPKTFTRMRDAVQVADAHPTGSVVTVYYDSKDPSRSCLEPGVIPGQFGLLALMSGGFVLMGLLILVSGGMAAARSGLIGQ